MSAWYCLLPLIGSLSAACQAPGPPDVPARYGLAQTTENREIIERAIVLVNEVLPRDMPLRLRPTWPQSGFYPTLYFEEKRNTAFAMEDVIDREFDNGWRFRNADEIPVFIVDATSLGQVETAFVPEGARTIFISGRNLERQFDTFYLRGEKAWEQYSSFEKSLVTAVILLHELGHVHFDDAGSYGHSARLALEDLTKPSSTIANKEVRADRFASEIISDAWNADEMKGRFSGAMGRSSIASNLYRVVAIASNTNDLVEDPTGAFDKVEKLGLFRASGYSHLNLYLRLLVILYQLEPTDERLKLLQRIDQAFAHASASGPH
ncbi:hypothetical protein [Bradyrhizobium sp. SRS-191]|uniref:hypothetical protein n=1 Tax=Bradyrhizobium sp. SRS-191 TaxID=2962606 RepID=UPI00211E6227|nr:hypothetical protein [Bradyrhizobium sp. SRS-191]